MLFEEFFKKKKINLAILQKGEPELFSEFKEHYAQMGEKSFDHTKKYWFNKLRRQYPLPPEVKTEKLHIENQIAEQTVADTLSEPTPNAEPAKLGFKPKFEPGVTAPQTPVVDKSAEPVSEAAVPTPAVESAEIPTTEGVPAKTGFKPRFKAGVTAKPASESSPDEAPKAEKTEVPSESTEQPAKIGFKPRFKAGVTASKPVDESAASAETKAESSETPSESSEKPTVKPGFTPRFKAGITTSKPTDDNATSGEAKAEPATKPSKPAEQPTEKLGFKPRFKAGVTTSKPAEETTVPSEAKAEDKPVDTVNSPAESSEETHTPAAPKLGFKPRFKAGVTTTNPTEQGTKAEEPKTENIQAETNTTIETPSTENTTEATSPKLGFKPRFKAGVTTNKPVEETPQESTEKVKAEEPESKTTTEEEKPAQAETPPAKQPYKPRFTPNMIKPKAPEGESE